MADALAALKSAVDTIHTVDFNYGCWDPARVLAGLRERGFDVVPKVEIERLREAAEEEDYDYVPRSGPRRIDWSKAKFDGFLDSELMEAIKATEAMVASGTRQCQVGGMYHFMIDDRDGIGFLRAAYKELKARGTDVKEGGPAPVVIVTSLT